MYVKIFRHIVIARQLFIFDDVPEICSMIDDDLLQFYEILCMFEPASIFLITDTGSTVELILDSTYAVL